MNTWGSLAHEIGWRNKGVPVDEPLCGVPVHLRNSLETLLGSSGTQTEPNRGGGRATPSPRRWTASDFASIGTLHPMHGDPGRLIERWLLPYLEARLDRPCELQVGAPDRWRAAGHEVSIDLLDVEEQARDRNGAVPKGTLEALGVGLTRVWSLAWLERLSQPAWSDAEEPLRIVVRGDHAVPILALLDALDLLEATRRAYGLEGRTPAVTLHAPDLGAAAQAAVRAYAGDVNAGEPTPDASVAHLALVRLGNAPRPHVAIGAYGELPSEELAVEWRAPAVMADAFSAAAQVGRAVPQAYRIADTHPDILDFFFQRFFPHPRLRPHQIDACARLLLGESLIVLLPTGYGKSAIFQFVALMQPGVAMIVTPLRSLVLDQIRHLERMGITAAGYLMSGGRRDGGRDTLQRLEAGHLRLLYLTPERLELTDFRHKLADWLLRRRFSLIAVDEVHCVSEWGHDFRPAYQQLRALRRFMNAEGVADVPIAGFTATASATVRADAARMLGIPPEQIVQSRSSDRPELSFSVHSVDGRGGAGARLEALSAVLADLPPRVLGMRGGLTARRDDGHFESGAIVFTPFAAANQDAFFANKAPAVADYLAEAALAPEHIGTHASSPALLCPECGSPRVKQHYRVFHCTHCAWSGERAQLRKHTDWDNRLLVTQDAFMDDRLPLLVSTKGFGMGVDKPNIRLIVHHVMSGSLEGYYQEAGRAGRDQHHAHVALLTVPPAHECASQYFDSGALFTLGADDPIPLPCLRKNQRGFPALRCPFGLTELCDVAQQAYLIDSNFPEANAAHQALVSIFQRAKTGEFSVPGQEANHVAGALARLQTLTVVEKQSNRWSGHQVTFRASVPTHWSWTDACDAVAGELRAYEPAIPGAATHSPVTRVADEVLALRRDGGTQDHFVEVVGAKLIDVVYTVVRASRLAGLYNLHRYATLPPGACRRVYLRSAFDVQPLTEAYSCGFCDNCVPDLAFGRTQALVPKEQTRAKDLSERLAEVIAGFDLDALTTFTREAYPAYAEAVRVRCEQLLEQRPNDLAVLYLAASAAAARGAGAIARSLATRSDAIRARQGASLGDRLRLLYAIAEWDPTLAQDVIGNTQGPFQKPDIPRAQLLEALADQDDRLALKLARMYDVERLVRTARGSRERVPNRDLARLRGEVRRALGGGERP